MRTLIRLCLAVALVSGLAASAHAQGINLSWNDCGANGVENRVFACNSNTGTNAMIASVIPAANVDRFVGIDIIMDLITETSPLPAWWDLDASTGCRNTSLSMGTDFSGTPSGGTACNDYFAAQGGGGIASYTAGFESVPNRARILAFWALANEGVLTGSTEHYMFRMVINNARTLGGTCPGCTDRACIVLNLIRLVQPAGAAGGDTDMTSPPPGGRQWVRWQDAGSAVSCAQVPTKNRTWGQIKSLYR